MFKNISLKKKSVIFNWLISYLMFLIIFGLLSFWIYFYTSKIIEKEINNANIFLLNTIQNDIDETFEEARKVSVEALFNTRIQKLLNLRKSILDQEYYDINLASQDLKNYSAPAANVDDVYIVLKGINKVVSSMGIYDTASFYATNYSEGKDGYEKWIKEYDDQKSDKYSLVFTSRNDRFHKILYIRSLSTLNKKDLTNSVTVSINEDKLLKKLSSIDKINKGTSFILSDSTIVTSSGQINLPKDFKLDSDNGSGTMYTTIDGKKVVVSHIKSSINDWEYVTVVPEEVFLAKVNKIKGITYVSIFLCFLIGISLMCYFLKVNYNPISKLMELLARESNYNNEDKDTNEYVIIEKGLKKTIADKDAIQNQLKNQKSLLKSNFLEKLLKGSAQSEIPVTEALDSYDIKFPSSYFSVMLFNLEETSGDDAASSLPFNEMCFIFANVMEELLSSQHKGIMLEVDNVLTCLVNVNQDRVDLIKSDLSKIVEEAQAFINNHFHLQFTVSVSNLHKGVDNIPIAYKEALGTMNNKMVLGIRSTLFYEDISRASQGTFYYPIIKEQQLINVIKSGDYDSAKAIIDEIYDVNFIRNRIHADLAQCLMLNLVSTLIRAVNEVSPQFNDNLLEDLNLLNRLLSCKSVDDLKHQLDVFLFSFCRNISSLNKKSLNWISNDVIPYIEQNYQDINLSVAQIAEEFDVHPVYLSKVFKDTVSSGLLDFIHKLRLEKSKQLMKANKDINMEELSNLVGFSNARTFGRVFKKYEGVAPGKFKETM